MDFNPFEHFGELVFTNIYGGTFFGLPRPETMPIGDQLVPTAVPGQPETKTYWLLGEDNTFHQISHDQAFVQELFLHAKYGVDISSAEHNQFLAALGLEEDYHITLDAMREAVLHMPTVLGAIIDAGLTEAQVWAYAQHEAPAIALVGVPLAAEVA